MTGCKRPTRFGHPRRPRLAGQAALPNGHLLETQERIMSITRREALFKMAALCAAGQLARASTRAPAVTPSPAAVDLAPRQDLLMDFGWRFHRGDSNDVDGDFEFGANQGPS